MYASVRSCIVLLLSTVVFFTACTSPKNYTPVERQQIEAHNELLSAVEQFVHANLYTGMIHVRSTNLQSWNQLLMVYACGFEPQQASLQSSYQNNQPIFTEAMVILAEGEDLFSSDEAQNALADVAQLAYRLFSVSYAKGYARQIELADELSPGIREELCDGRVEETNSSSLRYRNSVNWRSFTSPLLQNLNGLLAHAENADSAFQTLLNQQYLQFDALVYSHAYQQTDAYQTLFFEVNKFENVELYGDKVSELSHQYEHVEGQKTHNDFAYLVLSSGYHWGMMSVLAMLEEEYPNVHDVKKQQAIQLILNIVNQLD